MDESRPNTSSSWSMKMRATATRPNTDFDSRPSTSHTGFSSANNSSVLPKIRKMTASSRSRLSTPKSDVSLLYERLSGLHESENFFPDRGRISHPTAVCVRCSNNASICVACADTMAQNSVNFYRRTLAAGSHRLLERAIKQAGANKTLLFIMFRLWKNGAFFRKFQENKRKTAAEVLFGHSIIYFPFKAWQRYTKETAIERRERKIETMDARIKALEAQVHKLQDEKMRAEAKNSSLEDERMHLKVEIAQRDNKIKHLEDVVSKEQNRVMNLLNYADHMKHLSTIVLRSAKSAMTGIHKHITLNEAMATKCTDYRRTFTTDMRNKIQKKSREQAVVGKTPDTEHNEKTSFSTQITLSWINYASKCASECMYVPTGQFLDIFLPPYEKTQKFSDLKSGTQLCRIVTYFVMSAANENAEKYESVAMSREELMELKRSASDPPKLLALLFEHVAKYLSFPKYRINEIAIGSSDMIETLVYHLIYLSSVLTPFKRKPDFVDRFTEIILSFDALQKGVYDNVELVDNDVVVNIRDSVKKVILGIPIFIDPNNDEHIKSVEEALFETDLADEEEEQEGEVVEKPTVTRENLKAQLFKSMSMITIPNIAHSIKEYNLYNSVTVMLDSYFSSDYADALEAAITNIECDIINMERLQSKVFEAQEQAEQVRQLDADVIQSLTLDGFLHVSKLLGYLEEKVVKAASEDPDDDSFLPGIDVEEVDA